MHSESSVLVERDGSGIVTVSLNRPASLNAITDHMFDDLERAFDTIGGQSEDRAVIVTGQGRGFCSGLDLSLARKLADSEPGQILAMLDRWSRVMTALHEMGKPAIAAVNGPATGGGLALALACDVRFASPAAHFSVAFIRVGFTGGDMGVSYLLPRLIGLGASADLMLSGRDVRAEEAAQLGLVNKVVADKDLLDEARAWASLVVRNDPQAVALTKRALHANIDAASLAAALPLENRNQALMALSGSVQTGLAEFAQRRRTAQ